MKPAHGQYRSEGHGKTTRNNEELFTVIHPTQPTTPEPGAERSCQGDARLIRNTLVEAIRACGKSRATIADEMTALLGRKVTERMLNGYTAESQEDYQFPAELQRAFCIATGNDRLLRCMAELHGLQIIDAQDAELVELGRAFLQRSASQEKIDDLQRALSRRTK